MVQLVLGIGSNQGNRLTWLDQIIEESALRLGSMKLRSSVVESEPWGYQSGNWFLNQVIVVDTRLSPQKVMEEIHHIEAGLGRVRTGVYADRNADIDILFYADRIIKLPGLSVPHPHLADRRFVLMPLAEILPDFIDPLSGLSVQELLDVCPDKSPCHWYKAN